MKLIEGNVLWYDKHDRGILVDENDNEYYFDSSVIRTYPSYAKAESFALFSPSRIEGNLVAKDVFFLDSKHDELLDMFIEQERDLEDFINNFVLVDYLEKTFHGKWVDAQIDSVKDSPHKKGTYDIYIRYTDTRFPYVFLGYSEMVTSNFKPKNKEKIQAMVELYYPYDSNLMFSKIRKMK
jgi:hypothetical protein